MSEDDNNTSDVGTDGSSADTFDGYFTDDTESCDGSFSYFTHDNGSRPFRVVVHANNVKIYKMYDGVDCDDCDCGDSDCDGSECDDGYNFFVKEYDAANIYIGTSSGLSESCDHGPEWSSKALGNSIILDTGNRRIVFIGDCIYEFTLEEGDEIEKYYSPVGHSDVPYPVLVGKQNLYFMCDKEYLKRDDSKYLISEDLYQKYLLSPETNRKQMSNVTNVHNRLT